MKLNFAIFAEEVRISNEGNIEIYNPITDPSAGAFPAVHAEAAVVLNFTPGDTKEHELKIAVTGGYKKECMEPYSAKMVPAESPDHSVGQIVSLRDIPFEQEGEYKVEISMDGEILSILPFVIRKIEDKRPVPEECKKK